jgi:hypothetical protein
MTERTQLVMKSSPAKTMPISGSGENCGGSTEKPSSHHQSGSLATGYILSGTYHVFFNSKVECITSKMEKIMASWFSVRLSARPPGKQFK